MAFTITTKNGEKTFADKEFVNIGSNINSDIQMNLGFEFLLTVQYNSKTNTCSIINQFNDSHFLFKGQPVPAKLDIDKVCKIMIANSDEFISIKIKLMKVALKI